MLLSAAPTVLPVVLLVVLPSVLQPVLLLVPVPLPLAVLQPVLLSALLPVLFPALSLAALVVLLDVSLAMLLSVLLPFLLLALLPVASVLAVLRACVDACACHQLRAMGNHSMRRGGKERCTEDAMQGQKHTVACRACLNAFACPEAGSTVSRSSTKDLSNLSGPWRSHDVISWDGGPAGEERCAANDLIIFARPQAQSTAGRSATPWDNSPTSEDRCKVGGLQGQKHIVACRTSLNAFVCLQAQSTAGGSTKRALGSPGRSKFLLLHEELPTIPIVLIPLADKVGIPIVNFDSSFL